MLNCTASPCGAAIFVILRKKITKIRLEKPIRLCYNNGRRFGYASLNRKQVQFLREPVTVNAVVKITSSVCRTAASGNAIGKPRRHDGGFCMSRDTCPQSVRSRECRRFLPYGCRRTILSF